MKRYIKEYANDKIKAYKQLKKVYPANNANYQARIMKLLKVKNLYIKGLITADEAALEIINL